LLDQSAALSYLSTGEAVGAATLKVKNINAFYASWGIQVGKTGEEKAEVVIMSTATPSGTSLALDGTTRFDHPADSPVYAIKYNQVIFKRSTAGTSGTATAMTDGTVTITPDSDYTIFDDTSGSSTYAYQAAYYNSVTTETSADSDWMTTAGYTFYSLAKIRERIKNKLISANYIKDDLTIDNWVNEWLEKMTNTAIDVNKDYAIGTVDIAYSGTAELGTITETDFKEVRKVWFTADGTNWYQATKMDLNDFQPNTTFSETHPYFFYQGDNVIGRKPNETSGTVRVYYYKTNAILANDTDELPVAMRNYTKSFVDYSLGQAYHLDNKIDQGNLFTSSALGELTQFRTEISPRHKTGPQYIDIVASTDADDFELL